MTRQEQIEEIAVIGCVRNPQAHTAEECAKCDFKQGQCNAYRHAEMLYNAGYRKIMNGKELNSEPDEEECDVIDDYTIGFATYLMQKRCDEVDRMQAEIKRLKEENAFLLKACEGQFTFDTTENKKYSIFNSVRKEFAEKLKEKALLHCRTINCYECKFIETTIDELLEVEE